MRELFEVTVEFDDRANSQRGDIPPRKTVTTHVAVRGDYGESMVSRAGALAVRGVIGDADGLIEDWKPIVTSARLVGSVHLEPDPGEELK